MRILIDLRCLQSPSPRGGVGVFAEHLVRHLLAHDRANEYLLFANGFGNIQKHLPRFDAPNAQWRITHWPNKLWNAASLLAPPSSPFAPDVIFLPNLNFVPLLSPKLRLIVTIHDLSFEHFSDCFTLKQRLWHWFVRPRQLLARADAIIAVSETTKRDVVETCGIPESKVHVAYPGVESRGLRTESADRERVRTRHRLPNHFILTLSAFEPRKNFDGLIAAFEQLLRLHSSSTQTPLTSIHLVLAGARGSAERAIRHQVACSPARNRIHVLGPVSEDGKQALYALASCFVYPSFWEGFGFPPLEAMAAGTPVVASTGGSLPEILGEAALLVDPLDPAAIANAISRVLTDTRLRTDLITRGRLRAARFQWTEAVHRIRTVMEHCAAGGA